MAAKTAKDRAVGTDGQRRDRGATAVPAPAARRVAHLTPDERIARGKAARDEVPRSSHGRWAPAQNRPDPVALLEEQATTRVPELVPIRYGRMLVSPFTFYRGAALIMAADLAGDARAPACTSSSAATRTCRTSACSPRPSGGWSSTSTTSTRPFPARGSGTSSGWRASLDVAGRDNGFSPQGPTRDRARRRSRSTATAMREFAGDAQPRRLVRPPRRRRRHDASCSAGSSSKPRAKRPKRASPRPAPATACRRSPSSPTSSTASGGSSATRR